MYRWIDSTFLKSLLVHSCRLEGNIGLRKDAAVDRGPSLEQNGSPDQKDALHVRPIVHQDAGCDLPEDVLRVCSVHQIDLCAPGLPQRAGDLNDEDVIGGIILGIEGDVTGDGDASVELVDAGYQKMVNVVDAAAEDTTEDSISVIELLFIGARAPCGVVVRDQHVTDRCRQVHRSGCGIVRREGLASAGEPGRCRIFTSRVRDQVEAGNGCCGDGRDTDVSGDNRGIWYGGDTGRCEDHIVVIAGGNTPELDAGYRQVTALKAAATTRMNWKAWEVNIMVWFGELAKI
jgi:hypothetical protein